MGKGLIRLLLLVLVLALLATGVFGVTVKKSFAVDFLDVPVTEAKKMVDQGSQIAILDVRNQSEYNSGHIRNAKLIPVWQLASRLDELNKNDDILVYCKNGVRSTEASLALANNGFSHVYNMLEGITAWSNATYPIYVKYPSIQKAVDEANVGDTINVSTGLYNEQLRVCKMLTLQGEDVGTTIINANGNGTVVDITGQNVTITGFTIEGSGCSCDDHAGVYAEPSSENLNLTGNYIVHDGFGVRLNYATNIILSHNELADDFYACEITYSFGNSITENHLTNNRGGFNLNPSSKNIIEGNNITGNSDYDIMLHSSSKDNIFTENEIANSSCGISLYASFNNSFNGNTIVENSIGVEIQNSTGNSLYQNNFIDNGLHVEIPDFSADTWDEGNVTGGNYWNNYLGTDLNNDGIGDSPQILGSGNQDNNPLMGPFSAFTIFADNHLSVISNSTVKSLKFFSSNDTIRILLTNSTDNQQCGFCRLTIPCTILPPPYSVTVNGNPVSFTSIFENTTISVIHFNYQNSSNDIVVIPEYPLPVLLALAGGVILLLLSTLAHALHMSLSFPTGKYASGKEKGCFDND